MILFLLKWSFRPFILAASFNSDQRLEAWNGDKQWCQSCNLAAIHLNAPNVSDVSALVCSWHPVASLCSAQGIQTCRLESRPWARRETRFHARIFLKSQESQGGEFTVQICTNFACHPLCRRWHSHRDSHDSQWFLGQRNDRPFATLGYTLDL